MPKIESPSNKYMTDGEDLFEHIGFNQYKPVGRHFKNVNGVLTECLHPTVSGAGLVPYVSEETTGHECRLSHVDSYQNSYDKGKFT